MDLGGLILQKLSANFPFPISCPNLSVYVLVKWISRKYSFDPFSQEKKKNFARDQLATF